MVLRFSYYVLQVAKYLPRTGFAFDDTVIEAFAFQFIQETNIIQSQAEASF